MDRKQRADQLKGREVRRLATSTLECRDGIDGTLALGGYASTTGHAYDMGWYQETIARGAFGKTLGENPDVQLLVNHEGLPMARTTNGSLILREDGTGLAWDAPCLDGDDSDVKRVHTKVASGLMDQCSFAFRVVRQSWDEDYTQREITEVSLDRGDVSVVNYGANPITSVSIRSLFADMGDLSDDELAELRDDPAVITIVRKLARPLSPAAVTFAESPVGKYLLGLKSSEEFEAKMAEARAALAASAAAPAPVAPVAPEVVRQMPSFDTFKARAYALRQHPK